MYTCVFVESRETNDTITVDVFVEDSAHAAQKQLYTRMYVEVSKITVRENRRATVVFSIS